MTTKRKLQENYITKYHLIDVSELYKQPAARDSGTNFSYLKAMA